VAFADPCAPCSAHLAANSKQLLASAKWQRGVLERNGYTSVSFLPVADWHALPKHEQPAFLVATLEGLGVSVKRDARQRAARMKEEHGRAAAARAGGGGMSDAQAAEVARALLGGQQAAGVSAKELDLLLVTREPQESRQRRGGGGAGGSRRTVRGRGRS
jgi:hypothetical protein